MPDWATFAGLTAVLVVLLLVLSRSSQRVLEEAVVDGEPTVDRTTDKNRDAVPIDDTTSERDDNPWDDPPGVDLETDVDSEDDLYSDDDIADDNLADVDTDVQSRTIDADSRRPHITTRALLGNVVASQGLFLGLLVAAAWWTEIPPAAFGLAAETMTATHVAYGVLAGIGVYGGNEVGAAASERFGFSAPEDLREAMAPTNAFEWAFLLLIVLPVIAVFEELLFRGALIGVVHASYGVSPWLLAIGSSAVFGLGHGAQGRVGVAVTGLLGLALAALFVVSESLLLVIVAHYLINALEFVVRERLGWEPLAG